MLGSGVCHFADNDPVALEERSTHDRNVTRIVFAQSDPQGLRLPILANDPQDRGFAARTLALLSRCMLAGFRSKTESGQRDFDERAALVNGDPDDGGHPGEEQIFLVGCREDHCVGYDVLLYLRRLPDLPDRRRKLPARVRVDREDRFLADLQLTECPPRLPLRGSPFGADRLRR